MNTLRYKCLDCGRNKFTRMWQPHNCNGQYRKHSFPCGFTVVSANDLENSGQIPVGGIVPTVDTKNETNR